MPLLNDDAGGWPWIFVVRMVWCGMIEVCEGAPAYTHGKRCQIASTVVGPRVSVSGGVALVSRPKHAVIPRMANDVLLSPPSSHPTLLKNPTFEI